jgi:type IX secretion system PorP/SprF family membrane protein
MSLEGSENTESQEYETEISRMVYFTGGSNIQIKNTLFEIQPSFQVKTDFSTYTAEVTMRARYNKFITFGLGYRYKDAISAMIGAEYKNFFVGYAYDYPTSAIAKASSGSHELIAGYKLKLDFSGKNRNKHRSIRIM